MSIKSLYTESFREQALEKVYNRGEASIASVAERLNISYWTLKYWMRSRQTKLNKGGAPKTTRAPRPNKRNATERMQLLLDSQGLDEQALGAFCREHGLFTHQLQQWRDAFEAGATPAAAPREALRELKASHANLARELKRKEKALAEAAALLVLQKKFRALWEDEGE